MAWRPPEANRAPVLAVISDPDLTGDRPKERIAEIAASGFELLHKPVNADNCAARLAQLLA